MKSLILTLILLTVTIDAFSTAQVPDKLIYNGKTISLFYCPLEYYPNKELINPKSLFGSSGCFYTACYRNYIATWQIEDNRLYLVEIKNACYAADSNYVEVSLKGGADTLGKKFADLKSLFPDRYVDGRVFADWVSAKMFSPIGNLLFYIHDGFLSIFEKEIEFNFENGILISTQEHDNSKTRKSKYTSDSKLLMEFIEKSISYSNVPYPDKEIRVIVRIMGANEDGTVKGASVIRGINEEYDKEALRVINAIPDWDVVYRHGEIIMMPWSIPVYFRPKK